MNNWVYFRTCFKRIEKTFFQHNAPYHNNIHACDVLVTLHQLLIQTQLAHWFSDLELFSMLFAAAIHDLEHTGTNNQFHISTRSDLGPVLLWILDFFGWFPGIFSGHDPGIHARAFVEIFLQATSMIVKKTA